MTNLLVIATIIASTLTSNQFINPVINNPIVFGIQGNNKNLYNYQNLSISHHFTTWNPKETNRTLDLIKGFNKTYKSSSNRIKSAMLTVEPWPAFGDYDRAQFLTNIGNGMYDGLTKTFCQNIEKNSTSTIALRWGHEIDLYDSSRYPWAVNKPELYIKAYRRFVDICRKETKKASYIWSPSGNKGNNRFYPGDKYVDIVGMSWYSYPEFEMQIYKRVLGFDEIMDWKYNELKGYNKPIMAAEFGIAGTWEHKYKMYSNLNRSDLLKKKYPLMHSYVLFSDKTESWMPGIISEPDWTVDNRILRGLSVKSN